METSVSSAHEALSSTISQLEHLSSICEADSEHGKGYFTVNDRRIDLDEPMTLNAVTPDMQALQTSFGRELWFAGLHAVHHWSMIRVIAGELVSALRRRCVAELVADVEYRVHKSTGRSVLRRLRFYTVQNCIQNRRYRDYINLVMNHSIGLSR